MSLGFMLVTLSATLLAMLPEILGQSVISGIDTYSYKSSYAYNTTLIKGYVWARHVIEVQKANIAAGQCDGAVEYPIHYKCQTVDGEHAPFALQVQVLDNNGPSTISIDTQLRHASIYRYFDAKTRCQGNALVIVSVACFYSPIRK